MDKTLRHLRLNANAVPWTELSLVGSSPEILRVKHSICQAASTNSTVLVMGETGVGKEPVARAVHALSSRSTFPFIPLNCAALAETLAESELFGHERHAFTGADSRRMGQFEAADGGTIFLDEIGEMIASIQAKFLRILEGQPFQRVGGVDPINVDVRVIAATNRDLELAVRNHTFRSDLFYRLDVFTLHVPPLRQRVDDIPDLAHHFLRETNEQLQTAFALTPAAINELQAYSWPGNVRQLKSVIERTVISLEGQVVDAHNLQFGMRNRDSFHDPVDEQYRPQPLSAVIKQHIRDALQFTNGNKTQAAIFLGIHPETLRRRLKS